MIDIGDEEIENVIKTHEVFLIIKMDRNIALCKSLVSFWKKKLREIASRNKNGN